MGFYPKRLRRKAHNWRMRIVATAALSGCMFVKRSVIEIAGGDIIASGYEVHRMVPKWGINYVDGQQSHNYDTKTEAASVYLIWYLQKQGMFPRYR